MIDIEKFICSLMYRSSALSVIKVIDLVNALNAQGLDYQDGKIVRIVPELKENEDERVIERIKTAVESYWSDEPLYDILAWIEKQGEHANFRNKIQVGDKVTRNKDRMLVNLSLLNRVAKKGEQKTTDKVEPKFHEGDIIIHKELGGNFVHFPHKIIQVDILDKKYRLEGGFVAHFSEQEDYELVEHNPAWSQEDKNMIEAIEALCDDKIRFTEFRDVKEYAYTIKNWLKSLKDRVQPQPKQEWGEEDEKLLHDLSDTYFYNDEDYPGETYKQMLKRVLDWMNKRAKSLRPQNHWKPSEEQMEALDDFIYAKYPNTEKHEAAVKSLYQDLKRL